MRRVYVPPEHTVRARLKTPAIQCRALLGRDKLLVTVGMNLWGLTNLGFMHTHTLFLRLSHYGLAQAVPITAASRFV